MTKKSHLRQVSLSDKYELDQTKAYITGIEALVRLPILQHQRDKERGLNTAGFVSGYRGSPLGNVDYAMWSAKSYLDKHNITFVPGVNEDLAATAVRGSQEVGLFPGSKYDGVFGLWYGKGPGLDRSIDAFRHANAAGTAKYGGVLAVVGDDHGCKSSTFPYQSEHIFTSLSMPVLAPANVQEVLDLGILGWELSRYSGCWVGLKAITENMDSAVSAEIDASRINIVLPDDFDLPEDGLNVRWPDTPLAQEERLNKYKIYAALAFARVNNINKVVINTDKPRFGIATTGKSYLDVMQAFDDLGIDEKMAADIGIRVFKVGMPWPLEPVSTHEFCRGLEEILVVEEKRSVIEDQLTGQLYNWPVAERPVVVGEYDENGAELLTNLNELTPAMIARVIAKRLAPFYSNQTILDRVAFINEKEKVLSEPRLVSERAATFCSGCPHNSSTVVPEGSLAGGGIGCHFMSTRSKTRPAHNFTHMGGEGVTWTGIAPFTETKHVFQNLGDGTYFHSGTLAIRQSIASKVNITYKILFNDAVAMTGGQPVDGELSLSDLITQLKGEGVTQIELVSDQPELHRTHVDEVVSLHHRDDLNHVQKMLREVKGTTVLIYEQVCATEKRRRRKRGLMPDVDKRVFINDEVCEGCGDCSVKSNCLSVIPKETSLGRKRQIDQAQCNKDFSCVKGFCPSFVTLEGAVLKKKVSSSALQKLPLLPEPKLPDLAQPRNVLVTGVGGTGVITVAAVLSMAAHLEDKGVATLNQTGLAQKFGPVISHLRIAKKQDDIHAVRIAAGDADLLIGCDLLVSASDDALAKLHHERSHAVVNDTISATAEFINDPDTVFHVEPMKHSIERELNSGRVDFLPATDIASELLGDSIATNLFMVGYAYQKGLLPISAPAIEKAIELNGVQVEFNTQAFVWGRAAAHDLDFVVNASKILDKTEAPLSDFAEIVADRKQRLVQYQDAKYAQKYAQLVQGLVEKSNAIFADKADAFNCDIAFNLYKVMAYKDEYEVARMYSSEAFKQKLHAHFEEGFRIKYHLAPPLIAAKDKDTGHAKKRTFGSYMSIGFKVLAKLKWLRQTKFDPLGLMQERKMEKALLGEYLDTVNTVLEHCSQLPKGVDEFTFQNALSVINLVRNVRGYGHVKHRNYNQYQSDLVKHLAQLKAKGLSAIHVEAA